MKYTCSSSIQKSGCQLERAGRLEEAALPLYGVTSIDATLDPARDASALTVHNIKVYHRQGDVRIAFEMPRSKGVRPRRVTGKLLAVSDQMDAIFCGARAYQIRTPIVLGRVMAVVPLWLSEQSLRSTNLVIGARRFVNDYHIDKALTYALGNPQHSTIGLCSPSLH